MTREVRGLWSVFVVVGSPNDQKVSRRIVELLHVERDRVFVRGTLDVGDLVIANGTHRVVVGQKVRSKDVSATYPREDQIGGPP